MAGPLDPKSPLADPAADLSAEEGVKLPRVESLFPQMPGAPLQMGMGAVPIGGVRMPAGASVRDQIKRAYFNLTDNAVNHRVALTDIRGQLKHLPKEVVDAELQRMHLDPSEAHTLSGSDNPRDIDDILRSGMINFKGEPMYYLWITKH